MSQKLPSEPLLFEPLFQERIWGGRQLAQWGFTLPQGVTIGEVWALVDRPEAQSVVAEGSDPRFVGKSLHQLWQEEREEVFGEVYCSHPAERFPLLLKLLDATQRLSLQVHPPEEIALLLGGEPKTECWYVLEAAPGAVVYAGVAQGVTQELFLKGLEEGSLEELLSKIPVKVGDALVLPSGRLHSLGEGVVVVEVQQNSDTTYRVFDWNRCNGQGQQRELHLKEALKAIDFEDQEPQVTPQYLQGGLDAISEGGLLLAETAYFLVTKRGLQGAVKLDLSGRFALLTCLKGEVCVRNQTISAGETMLLPASLGEVVLSSGTEVEFLWTRLPQDAL